MKGVTFIDHLIPYGSKILAMGHRLIVTHPEYEPFELALHGNAWKLRKLTAAEAEQFDEYKCSAS